MVRKIFWIVFCLFFIIFDCYSYVNAEELFVKGLNLGLAIIMGVCLNHWLGALKEK